MEGILEFTFVSRRRGDQKPVSMVTAVHGTPRVFAWGDFLQVQNPLIAPGRAGREGNGILARAPDAPIGLVNSPKSFCAPGENGNRRSGYADRHELPPREFLVRVHMISLPEISGHNGGHDSARWREFAAGLLLFISTSVSVLFTYKNAVVTEPDFQ